MLICLFIDEDLAPSSQWLLTCAVKCDDLAMLSSTLCPVQITNDPHPKKKYHLLLMSGNFFPASLDEMVFVWRNDWPWVNIYRFTLLSPLFLSPLCVRRLSFLSGFVHDYSPCHHDPVLQAGRFFRLRLSRHCVLRLHHSGRALRPQGKNAGSLTWIRLSSVDIVE